MVALLTADSFNRADNASSLGSTDGAGTLDPVAWTASVGTLGIGGNAGYCPSGLGIATIDVGHSNVDLRLTMLASGGSTYWGMILRYSDSNNYIRVVKNTSDGLVIVKKVAGAETTLFTSANFTLGLDEVKVVAINNVITVSRGSTILARVIEPFNRSATRVGFIISSNAVYAVDDFSCRTVNVPAEIAIDTFNRLDGNIGSTDGTGTLDPVAWSSLTGNVAISSNEASHGGSTTIDPLGNGFTSSTGANIAYIDAATPNVTIHLKADFTGNSVCGIVFRFVDTNNYWLFYLSQTSNQAYLFKRVAGVWTNVSGTLSGLGTGIIYTVRAAGSTIIIEQRGALLYTVADTALQSATKHGFEVGGGGLVDNFQMWVGDAAIPVIDQVGPTEGPTGGGTDVTIVGNNFTGATDVKFGSLSATAFSVITDKHIQATTPSHSAAIVHTIVTNADGDNVLETDDQFTFATPSPIVSSVTPSHGPPAGGTSVVLTGAYFTGATSVKFGTTEAGSFTVDNDGQITASTPAHVAGVTPVIVTTPYGTNG